VIQNLVVTRGQRFKEVFNFKNPDGSSSSGRGYKFVILIYRRDFIREYPLSNRGGSLEFNLNAEQTKDFDSNVLSYKIVVDNETREVVAQGVLRVE
jgi:hypothetical protein